MRKKMGLSREIKWLGLVSACSFIVILPLCVLEDIPQNDIAMRYVPMIRAALAGEWKFFMHPRIPPAFPLVSYAVAFMSNANAFLACKLTSLFFFCIGIFPLFFLMRRVFNPHIASWSCGVYLLCTYLITAGYSGLRESTSCFALLLTAAGLVALWFNSLSWKNWLWLLGGTVILSMTRIEGQIFCMVVWPSAWAIAVFRGKQFILPYRWLVSLFILSIPLLIWAGYNYSTSGYFVTDPRMITIIKREKAKAVKPASNPKEISRTKEFSTGTIPKSSPTEITVIFKTPKHPQGRRWFWQLLKGFYPYFLIFALPALFLRIYNRNLNAAEIILIVFLILYPGMLIAEIHAFSHISELDKRYLLPVIPLYFGWTAITIKWIHSKLLKGKRKLGVYSLTALVMMAIFVSSLPVLRNRLLSEKRITMRNAILAASSWLKKELKPVSYDRSISINAERYHTGRNRILYTNIPALACMADLHILPLQVLPTHNGEEPIYLAVWQNEKEVVMAGKKYIMVCQTGQRPWDITIFRYSGKDK